MEQTDFLPLTREGYDRTAAVYAERFHHHLDNKPVDRAMVSAFAGLILKGADKRVIDVGCGTGVTTAMLASSGIAVVGIDLSPNIIDEAQRYAELVREPDDDGFESTSQAYLVARKPSVPAS